MRGELTVSCAFGRLVEASESVWHGQLLFRNTLVVYEDHGKHHEQSSACENWSNFCKKPMGGELAILAPSDGSLRHQNRFGTGNCSFKTLKLSMKVTENTINRVPHAKIDPTFVKSSLPIRSKPMDFSLEIARREGNTDQSHRYSRSTACQSDV